MAVELKMPALSPTMEEGTLAKWLVKEGDEVKSGDILAEIETDKATMEFEAVDEGTIGKILIPEGTENVKVGTVIASMASEGEEEAHPNPSRKREGSRLSPRFPHLPPSRLREGPGVGLCRNPPPPNPPPTQPSRRGPRWSRPPYARRCATRWPRKCAPTTVCS